MATSTWQAAQHPEVGVVGGESGLIWCQAGMRGAFQSQLGGRATCLRFQLKCQLIFLDS